jgi:hypothetical protein
MDLNFKGAKREEIYLQGLKFKFAKFFFGTANSPILQGLKTHFTLI